MSTSKLLGLNHKQAGAEHGEYSLKYPFRGALQFNVSAEVESRGDGVPSPGNSRRMTTPHRDAHFGVDSVNERVTKDENINRSEDGYRTLNDDREPIASQVASGRWKQYCRSGKL